LNLKYIKSFNTMVKKMQVSWSLMNKKE